MNNNSSPHVVQWQHQVITFTNTYVLFCQILFGCSGNVLNLIVLVSRKMRSRTNLTFAVMAFADLFFLLVHIPQFMFFSKVFLHNSQFYRESIYVIRGIQNWFSAISIWCMMYATIERVQVLRSPFRTSRYSVSPRFVAAIAFIVCAALGVTAPTFAPPTTFSPNLSKSLMLIHAVSVVLIPLVVCSLLNILLVITLKKNTMPTQMLKDSQTQQTLLEARNKTEKKITVMVTVIITSFVVCNAPGAILHFLAHNSIISNKNLTVVLLQTISNSLVITAKVLNFVLFCMSSDHFRTLLRHQLASAFDCTTVDRRSSYRSATKTFSIPLHDL